MMEPRRVAKEVAAVWYDGVIANKVEPRAHGTGPVTIDVHSFPQPPPLAAIALGAMFAANQQQIWASCERRTWSSLPRNVTQRHQSLNI